MLSQFWSLSNKALSSRGYINAIKVGTPIVDGSLLVTSGDATVNDRRSTACASKSFNRQDCVVLTISWLLVPPSKLSSNENSVLLFATASPTIFQSPLCSFSFLLFYWWNDGWSKRIQWLSFRSFCLKKKQGSTRPCNEHVRLKSEPEKRQFFLWQLNLPLALPRIF